jgi:hypothetical protein
MADHSAMKLGRLPVKPLPGLPLLSAYTAKLPLAPDVCDWSRDVTSWGVLLNDRISDCTCAAAGHQEQVWTLNASSEFTPPDISVETMYEASCGYDPSDPTSDVGGVCADVLTWWVKNGLAGHKPDAFVAVAPENQESVRDGIEIFGGVYTGAAMPLSAQTQDVWDVPAGGPVGRGKPGSWGGHCFLTISYTLRGLTCITWGGLKQLTWAWWDTYVEESYCILSKDWIAANGAAPNKLAYAQIVAAYQAMGGGQLSV